jgi:Zn-dependent hydrolases, including glyoxylases
MNVIQLTYKSVNYYLIPGDDGWVMIDTGLPDTFCQLLQMLNQHNISIYEINYLIITHFHPGHAGLTQNLKDFGTNLILHQNQVNYYSKLNTFYKKNPKANFKDITSSNHIIVSDFDSRDFLKSIGIEGELISTPGHSEDSISLVVDDDCAFTGDLPVYSMLEAYDDIEIEDSWDLIRQYHVKTVYPGHGDSYEI